LIGLGQTSNKKKENLMDKTTTLERFKEILDEYPGISANSYDRLKVSNKPNRSAMCRKYGVKWLGLVAKVGTGTLRDSTVERNKEGVYQRFTNQDGHVSVKRFTIISLEEAIAIAEVDLDMWVVDRWLKNTWPVTMKLKDRNGRFYDKTVTMHHVKIWFKLRDKLNLYSGMKDLISRVPRMNLKYRKPVPAPTGIAAEMALIDAHIGKLSWSRETGQLDYDLKISVKDYMNACDQNLQWIAPFNPEKIFYIVGQDIFHVENFEATTPKGKNQLDADSRLPKIYRQGMETVIRCVKACADVAPTEVIWIPGNHDMHASLFLCMLLEKLFEGSDRITVDVSEQQRKARLWGNLLIGWTHQITGRINSWTNELAQAFPELWGKSRYREWHFGHKHKKMEIKTFPTMTDGGVLLRQLTALSPIDFWHYENLFTDAVPGGEAFLHSKEYGCFANFTAWTTRK
jgi:hypothetical protein